MNYIKKSYFLIVFGWVILMVIFTFFHINGIRPKTDFILSQAWEHIDALSQNPHSIFDREEHLKNVTYIKNQLLDAGLIESDYILNSTDYDNPYQKPIYKYINDSLLPQFSQIKRYLSVEERANFRNQLYGKPHPREEEINEITNLVAIFPSKLSKEGYHDQSNVLVICAHYDSVLLGPGASDDNHAIGAMLQVINQLNQTELNNQNDIIFLFTDAEEYGHQGTLAFLEFNGYYNIVNRIKFVANFESRGSNGSSIMFETGKYNYNLINEYTKINTTIFSSSIANSIYSMMPNNTDFTCFKKLNIQGLNFANIGSGENYRYGPNDNMDNLNKTHVVQHGDIMIKLVDHFKNYNLEKIYSYRNAVYFTYLGLFTINYSYTFARVCAILLILLQVFLFFLLSKKKIISLKSFLKGIIIQILTLGIIVLIIFPFSWLISLFDPLYSKLWLLLVFIVFIIFLLFLSYSIAFKILKVNSHSISYASSLIILILAIGTTFLSHEISYPFLLFSLLQIPLNIIDLLVIKRKQTNNYKPVFSTIAFILVIPLFVSLYLLIGEAIGVKYYYLISIIITLFGGYITPYFVSKAKSINLIYKNIDIIKQ